MMTILPAKPSFAVIVNQTWGRPIFEMVADEIREIPTEHSLHSVSPPPAVHIERASLADALDRLFSMEPIQWRWTRRNLIYVAGEPGSGKTHLLHKYLSGTPHVWVDAQDEDMMVLSVCRLLEARRVRARDLSIAGLRLRFADLLSVSNGPAVVVIDGWPQEADLHRWLPTELKSTVIVTTRQAPTARIAPIVSVEQMTHDESDALVTALNPDLAGHECELSEALGGRPRALVHACAFLTQHSDLPVAEFCKILRDDIRDGLSAIAHHDEPRLAALYTQTISSLRGSSAETLLAFLAYVGHSNMTERCAIAFMAGNPGYSHTEPAAARVRYLNALKPLVELGLIHRISDRLYLDPLTAHIARALTADARPNLIVRIACYFTYDNEEHTLIELWDLKRYGWSAADIASYMTAQWLAMLRLDLDLLKPDSSVTTTPPVFESASQYIWQNFFIFLYPIDGPKPSSMLSFMQQHAPQRTQYHLVAQWTGVQDAQRQGRAPASLTNFLGRRTRFGTHQRVAC